MRGAIKSLSLPETQFTTTAGIYFIAYKIALLGLVPALVRHGMRGVDLVVSNNDGSKAIALQVRTASTARRSEGGDAFSLQFPITQRQVEVAADNGFFCFVDLRTKQPLLGPDVYVVPATQLKEEYSGMNFPKYAYVRHQRSFALMEPYRNNWDSLVQALAVDQDEVVPEPIPLEMPWSCSEIETSHFI